LNGYVRYLLTGGAAAALLGLLGCAFGPTALETNRIRYNEALRDTWNQQFLLNIVRIRYRDAPQFDAITNILASHAFDASISAHDEWRNQTVPAKMFNNNLYRTFFLTPSADISERPTLTISPLEGPEFTRSLLGNVHLENIVLLSSTGWDVDRVLRLTVKEMNHLENLPHLASLPEPWPHYQRFNAVAHCMRQLQMQGLLEFAYNQDTEKPVSETVKLSGQGVLKASDLLTAADKNYNFHVVAPDSAYLAQKMRTPVLRLAPDAARCACAANLWGMLQLNPGAPEYPMLPGALIGQFKAPPAPGTDLVITTHSVLETMVIASKGVEVPPRHIEKGLVTFPVDANGQPFDWTCVTGDLMRIRSQKAKPLHAFAKVKYRGYWFYIDDADQNSKSTFNLIIELYGLELAGGVVPGPVVTVPVGGGLSVSPGAGSGGGGGRGTGGGGG
jgi:hypothetical protein